MLLDAFKRATRGPWLGGCGEGSAGFGALIKTVFGVGVLIITSFKSEH